MKLVKKTAESGIALNPAEYESRPRRSWKLLVIDDEPDILALTRLNLRNFCFDNRVLEIIEAGSAYEAREILGREKDIAVALIDVVMETDDAGLQLVEYIRNTLCNKLIRLVIRTGQPGMAPERFVIDNYDIDDYRDKTEMTSTRLYTTVRSALKAHRDLKAIDLNRQGLEKVLEAAPDIYHIAGRSIHKFFDGVLTQVIGLCHLSEGSFISTIPGLIVTLDGQEVVVQATTGEYIDEKRLRTIQENCLSKLTEGTYPEALRKDSLILPLEVMGNVTGFIYIEPTRDMTNSERDLIRVAARQCSSALENIRLHFNLEEAYDNSIKMLAQLAEYKDKTTGEHIHRLAEYSRILALELGYSEQEAARIGRASQLHDVGKVGIPDYILHKPAKLSPEEYEIIKHHTVIGADILSRDKYHELAANIARHHHERWDGFGYPEGIQAKKLPLEVRIVSVTDVFDALVCARPYKEAWPKEKAADLLEKGSGTQFDPIVVKAFIKAFNAGKFDRLIESAQNVLKIDQSEDQNKPS